MTEYITLSESLKQVERWCYDPVKIEGKIVRIPNSKKVKEYLEGLFDQMTREDFLKLANIYKDIALSPTKKGGQRGRPRGPLYGLTGAKRAAKERELAKKAGVWHLRYPNGCIDCGSTDYKHVTGGLCTRCKASLNEMGVSMKQYREMVEADK